MIKNKLIKKTQAVLLALYPILGLYYILRGLTIGFILLALFFIIEKKKRKLNKNILVYFTLIISLSFISYIFSVNQSDSLFINNTLQVILFAFLLSYYTTSEYHSLYAKSLLVIGFLSTLFLFFQLFSFYILNKPITLYLPIGEDMIDKINFSSIHWGRPGSFFKEPAHYAIFILPIFYYTMESNKTKMSLFFLIGILFSTSTTGFAIAVILIIYYQLFKKRNFKFVLALLIVMLVVLIVFYEHVFFLLSAYINKLSVDSVSENIRVFGTLELFEKLDNFSFFFGVGHNQLSHYMSFELINVNNYANGFIMTVFSYGIFSLFFLIILLRNFYYVNIDKGYFIIFILVLLSDQILFNQNFFYLVICIYLLNESSKKKIVNSSVTKSKLYNIKYEQS